MAIIIDGTTGVSGVDGSAGTPAYQGTDSNTGITFPAADTVGISTSGTERLRIDSSGNLGLGVTPSAWTSGTRAIQVGTYAGLADTPGGGGGFGLYGNAYEYASGAYKYLQNYYATLYRTYAGQHQFYTAPSGTAGNAITFTQAMTLDASGRLGIGTTSPSARLHVVGGNAADLNNPAIFVENNKFLTFLAAGGNWGAAMFADSSDNGTIVAKAALTFGTGTSATERARIHASGGVSIGNTTDPGAGNLSVTGSISDSIGDVRTIIQNAQSGAGSYTLVATDAGKHIYVTGAGGVTMPVSVFSVGQAITIVNNTSSSITITGPSAGTMYLAGTATTGNRTLAQRGICTAIYVVAGATPTIIISGSGLT